MLDKLIFMSKFAFFHVHFGAEQAKVTFLVG